MSSSSNRSGLSKRSGQSARIVADRREPSGYRADLTLTLDEIGDDGIEISEEMPEAWLSALLNADLSEGLVPWGVRKPSTLDLSVFLVADIVRVVGTAKVALVQDCVRCLRPVPFAFTVDFDLHVLEASPEWIGSDPIIDLDPHDLARFTDQERPTDAPGEIIDEGPDEVAAIEHGKIPLARLIREQILLTLPMNPRCDQRGSEQTGACEMPVNASEKEDEKKWRESRWGGLAALRDKLASETDETES